MSLSENSARDDSDTLMDTDDTHFVQPAPPDKPPATPTVKGKSSPDPASTIMITNKYSNAGVMSQTQNSNNSIMILTSHSPEVSSITSSSQINICINNHFSDTISSSSATVSSDTGAQERPEALPEPDSTTCHFKDSRSQTGAVTAPPTVALPPTAHTPAAKVPDFVSGDEVLVRRDDLFYLGTVMVVGRKQCCVSFGDDTKCWAYFQEMRKIVPESGRGPVCVHCKEHSGQEPESVVDVCKRCHRGYHKKCSGVEGKSAVHCKRCFEQNSLNGVNGGKYFNKNNNLMGDERLSYSDNSLSPFDTGNFFRSSDYKDAWSGSSDLSTGSSNGNYKGRKMSTCGRRLRERQEKNYAESTRRPAVTPSNPQASTSSGCSDASSSSSSSSSLVNFSAATFLSQQLLSSQRGSRGGPPAPEKGLSVFSKIFDTSTPSHLANGDKYVIRGKRIDVDGNIQYLVEWEGVS